MNLVLDFGNTITKIAVFKQEEIIFHKKVSDAGITIISEILDNYSDIEHCIVSSVAKNPRELIDYLKNKIPFFLELDSNTSLPIINKYKTPGSLGYDRIAGLVGAQAQYPGRNIMVIDAGSAITYDFLNLEGEYMGGTISPGAMMRARALHKFTARLPLIEPEPAISLFGDTTHTAINSGILNGILFEMNGYIEKFTSIYKDLVIFLTGGDYNLFDKKLKYSIFVDSNLNLKGLNRILSYNAK